MTALLHESMDALSALEALDPNALTDGELHDGVVELHHLESRLGAVRARLLAVWDARQVWAEDGSKAAWARLARECRLSSGSAKCALARARKLASMPATAASLRAGKLSIDQADLLRAANQPKIAELFARDELLLIGQIQEMRLDDAHRAINYWVDLAFEELGHDRPIRSRDGRYLTMVRTFNHTFDLRGLLDPLAGTEVLEELGRIERELFEADWAEAKADDGDNAVPTHLPRTAGQRRADALQVMARNSAGFRAGVHRHPAPLITVHCGYGTFSRMCELSDGTVVSPEEVVPYLCEGDIERIVFAGPSRVIDVGVRQRFFTGALRRAIQVRDRRCQHPSGCDVIAEHCHIDHIIEYTNHGGLTTQDNGRCLCRKHNLRRNNHPDDLDQPDERPPPDDDTS